MFIYVIGTNENKQKIGYSKNPNKRLSTLQTGNPEHLFLHHIVEVSDKKARKIEQKIHKEINYLRIQGEWFNMSKNKAISLVDHAIIRWHDDALI